MFTDSEIRVEYWVLSEISSLNDIVSLFGKKYIDINESNVPLNYQWHPYNGKQYEIIETLVNNQNVKYIPVLASIEYLKVKKSEAALVPRDIAVGVYNASLLFVEVNHKIIVLCSSSANGCRKVRSKMITKGEDKKNWGKLTFDQRMLDKTFFYWLLSKIVEGEVLTIDQDTYVISDSFSLNSQSDREQYTYSGDGPGVYKQTPTEAMICDYNVFSQIGVALKSDNEIIKFKLNEKLSIEILTAFKLKETTVEFYDPVELVLRLYLFIIPGIIQNYNSTTNVSLKEQQFRKNTRRELIKKLLQDEGINLESLAKDLALKD